jgi:conjugative relaxase-like TrwC/TraI family protein
LGGLRDVLSIAKLAPGGQRYYLEQADGPIDHAGSVASGVEDYYTGGNEPPGRWMGAVAAELGLEHRLVGEQSLARVLAHQDSATGEDLPGPVGRARIPGFDLVFSVPKSASVLAALGDPEVREAVWRAQRCAVGEALRYLESEAARGRLGAGGQGGVFEGSGLLAAAFEHRTSRAGDPQVHTHVLVANLVRRPDGRWAALDGRLLYAESKTAGYVHEAAFRRALVRELGVEWGSVRRGIAELDGVPESVLRAFSRRSREIDAYLAEHGGYSPAARQVAAHRTRQAKDYRVRPEQLATEWRLRADALGFSRDELTAVLDRARARQPARALAEREVSDALTEHAAHFARRDVIRHLAEQARDGASLHELTRAADRYLQSPEVVPLIDAGEPERIRLRSGRTVAYQAHRGRFSTVPMLVAERRVLDFADAARDTSRVLARAAAVTAAVDRRPMIGADQAAMVRRLCLERNGVQIVVGRAGSGKTYALAAAHDAWRASGVAVRGAAVARAAARGLQDATGIPSTSVAALLAQLDRDDPRALPARGVLVIDEAGMLGTRDLAALLGAAAQRETRVVLVGDEHQLPEIAAGGAFAALQARLPAIELTSVRRQRDRHTREILDAVRDGDSDRALRHLADRGDLTLVATEDEAMERLVADYISATASGQDAIMLALRRREVDALNRRARAWMTSTGRVSGESVRLRGTEFAAGDRIVLRANDRRLAIDNGTRGRVSHVHGLALTVALDDGRQIALPPTYLYGRHDDGPAIQHGYAFTAHVAQGTTVDAAFVLATDAAYREWAYVALSRARDTTRLYAFAESLGLAHAQRGDIAAIQSALGSRLRRTQAQSMALELADEHVVPAYIAAALGPRPESRTMRDRWDRARARIDQYRDANAITHVDDALGPRPREPAARREWLMLDREIQRTNRHRSRAIERDPGRGLG